MSKARKDSFGMFWEDKPKEKLTKDKPVKIKMLPPPLIGSWDNKTSYAKSTKAPVILEGAKPPAILDIECYSNYFLISIMRLSDNKIISFEITSEKRFEKLKLVEILEKYEIVTFNGNSYDIPLLSYAVGGANNQELKIASDDIINGLRTWDFWKKYSITQLKISHIDLIELAPGQVSLKLYGARLHSQKLQDLPIEPGAVLTEEQMGEIKTYCANDLDVTRMLYVELGPQISLRRTMSNQYRTDLRSKSDAQIAEEIIKLELTRTTGKRIANQQINEMQFNYEVPGFIQFNSEALQNALELVTTKPFTVTKAGRIEMPKELITLKVPIGESIYQMGMGGLHSTESSCYHITNAKYVLYDFDVSSYYPEIILRLGLYPKQLGKTFLDVYSGIVAERLDAKHSGNKVKADVLKIVINGSFGKLGSPYSALYAPELMVQVTVTGQLCLLMLIAMLEDSGIPVTSGNTDGIVIKCPIEKESQMKQIVNKWEDLTGFSMENTIYAGVYSRDVNNYIAIKYNGDVKTKGCFSGSKLGKNPQNEICNIAMIEYLCNGTDFEETIRTCKDITKFISARTVKGGAIYKKNYLGKAIRWYYAKGSKEAIYYKTNNNQVARTLGSKPIMDLPERFPDDIDYDWYIQECYNLF